MNKLNKIEMALAKFIKEQSGNFRDFLAGLAGKHKSFNSVVNEINDYLDYSLGKDVQRVMYLSKSNSFFLYDCDCEVE
ncbi:hypothetical protein AGMMS49573_07910 [Endomicrobiia bacterium]|nr:hypothetical protein AGMMS49573_07910 [Endomicrobiia bacterium]